MIKISLNLCCKTLNKVYEKMLIILLSVLSVLQAQPVLELVEDINPGEQNSDPGLFVEIIGIVFFQAYDGLNGIELWRTDATEAGTSRVKNIGAGAASMCELVWGCGNEYSVMNNILYFRATDNIHGAEIWRSDGAEAGTYMLKDINPGISDCSNSFFMSGQYFAVMDDILYFAADGGGNNIELWRSDGTEAGTYLVKDFAVGGSSVPEFITAIDNNIYFRCINGAGESELWKSDGTEAGSVLLKQMWVIAKEYKNMFMEFEGYIYFAGDDDDAYDQELWRTDGTPSGTELFMNVNPFAGDGSEPHQFFILNEKLFFLADDGADEFIFTSDGTIPGTQKLLDENGDSFTPNNYEFLKSENKIYFAADNEDDNSGIWITDGTKAGTRFLSDIESGAFNANGAAVVSGNNIVYQGYDESFGCTTVFQSNGTEDGTFQILDYDELTYPYSMITYNGKVLLNGNADAVGAELWMLETEFNVDVVEPDDSGFQIYPNPANDYVVIKQNTVGGMENIMIINALGQIVLQSKTLSEQHNLNIKDLDPGIYVIISETFTQKLIVK